MDEFYRRPNLLRLIGITLKDYVPVEDVADERLIENSADSGAVAALAETDFPPDKIPRVFTGVETWPQHSNLKCWECDFTFDDSPKFVPLHVREGENGGVEFGVLGNMCSFNCAELWIETHHGGRASNEDRWRYQENLCLVYFMFTGRRVARIKPAPPKTLLRAYGGDLDEDTFWRRLRELDPAHGLRDHTPGSVVPERDRARNVTNIVANRAGPAALSVPRVVVAGTADASLSSRQFALGEPVVVSAKSAWALCGIATAASSSESSDSVAVAAPVLAVLSDSDLADLLGDDSLYGLSQQVTSDAAVEVAPAPTVTAPVQKTETVSTDEMDLLLAEMGAL